MPGPFPKDIIVPTNAEHSVIRGKVTAKLQVGDGPTAEVGYRVERAGKPGTVQVAVGPRVFTTDKTYVLKANQDGNL